MQGIILFFTRKMETFTSFSKITEDSLGSQKTIAASSLGEAVSNKMILCFPETHSWLQEVENDSGAA